MNRLRIFALLAALFALATAFAACGGEDSDSPEAILENASFEGVESGNIDLSLAIDAKGSDGGSLDFSLSGPFQSGDKGQPPRLSLAAKANGVLAGDRIDFDGGLVLFPNKAYVSYDGVDYEVDPTTFSFVKSSIEAAQEESGQSEEGNACQDAAGELEVEDFVTDLRDKGSAEVGGTSTTRVSGELDVPSALDSLIALSNDPACESQLSAVQGPLALTDQDLEEVTDELEGAVKSAPVEVSVGDDDIVRALSTELVVEPEGEGSGPERMDIDLDFALTGVNEEQPIVAPTKVKPLNDLFLKLGINPLELLGLLEGGGVGELGNLLGRLGSGGASGGNGGSGGGQSYSECLQGARSAADIQKCGSKLG